MKAVAFGARPETARPAAPRPPVEIPEIQNPRILVVDDHPANLVAFEAVLAPLGHELVMCNSGEEALRHLLASEFALILLDVQMPGLDGFKTAELIKERPRSQEVPIIFITALSRETNNVFRGYAQGAVDYILKPFEPEILRSKVSVFVQLFLQREKIKRQEAELRARERAEEERKNEERVRALVDAMPLCVWAANADGKPYYCNEMWFSYSGLTAEQSTHFGIDAVHPEDVDALRLAIDESLASAHELEIEVRFQRVSDGHYRWHLLRAVPEKQKGRIQGWIATATDIEQRKRDEEARGRLLAQEQQAREEAQAANRMKDEFLATVSHELRTPLTAILGWIRIMRSGKLDPAKFARATEVIERNGRAQAAIIDDILDVSRIITGKLRLELDAIDLPALVQAALDSIRPAADAKEISVEWQFDLPDERRFAGDPDRMQQVVWNLVSNAIKFTPRGGHVQVDARQMGSHVELSVKDSGQGIEPEFLPHVFDRFRQADGTSTRRHGGLGLGLAIVRHLVELHGGTVDVDSPGVGKGSTFTVNLPVRAVQPIPLSERSSLPARPANEMGQLSLAGLSVLVVDDEADARELIATVLEQAGARTFTASNVEEALAHVVRDHPDVLLTDIGMPGSDGYTLLQKVRELDPADGGRIPAAALTAYSRIEDARRAVAAGFLRHVAKPVEPAFLVAQVAALAGRPGVVS